MKNIKMMTEKKRTDSEIFVQKEIFFMMPKYWNTCNTYNYDWFWHNIIVNLLSSLTTQEMSSPKLGLACHMLFKLVNQSQN